MHHRHASLAELAARLGLPIEQVESWPQFAAWRTSTDSGPQTCPPTARTAEAEAELSLPPRQSPCPKDS